MALQSVRVADVEVGWVGLGWIESTVEMVDGEAGISRAKIRLPVDQLAVQQKPKRFDRTDQKTTEKHTPENQEDGNKPCQWPARSFSYLFVSSNAGDSLLCVPCLHTDRHSASSQGSNKMTTERPSFFFFCFFFPLCRARLAPPDLNCRRQISSTSSNPRSFVRTLIGFVLCVRICANFRWPEEQHQKTILQWASPVLKAEGMQTTKEFAETGVQAMPYFTARLPDMYYISTTSYC